MTNYDKNRMFLLKKADSNWELYYDPVDMLVKSIATDEARQQGCTDSFYGSVNHFLRMFEWRFKRKRAALDELTPIGLIIRDKWIQSKVPVVLDKQKTYWDQLIVEEMRVKL